MSVIFEKLAETPLGQSLKTGQKCLGDETYQSESNPRQGQVASTTTVNSTQPKTGPLINEAAKDTYR